MKHCFYIIKHSAKSGETEEGGIGLKSSAVTISAVIGAFLALTLVLLWGIDI